MSTAVGHAVQDFQCFCQFLQQYQTLRRWQWLSVRFHVIQNIIVQVGRVIGHHRNPPRRCLSTYFFLRIHLEKHANIYQSRTRLESFVVIQQQLPVPVQSGVGIGEMTIFYRSLHLQAENFYRIVLFGILVMDQEHRTICALSQFFHNLIGRNRLGQYRLCLLLGHFFGHGFCSGMCAVAFNQNIQLVSRGYPIRKNVATKGSAFGIRKRGQSPLWTPPARSPSGCLSG